MEEWKDVVGYKGFYEISDLGRVKSLYSNGRILSPAVNRKGYQVVVLYLNKGTKGKKIHRLVAEAFIPNPENKEQVNHKDGNKLNNKKSNLEWNTQSENQLHAHRIGIKTSLKGESHGSSVLTEAQAIEIKYGNKGLTHLEIAKLYGVSKSLISMIRIEKNWTHI